MGEVLQSKTIGKALEEAAAQQRDSRMYIFRGTEISFKEVNQRSDQVASGLLKLGFKKGDRLGIIGLVQPEWLYTYFAAAKIGVTIVALNVRYRDMELDYMLNQSEARGVITLTSLLDMDYVKFFDGFREKIPSVQDYIFIGGEGFSGSHSFDDLLKTDVDEKALNRAKADVKPDDLMIIIYTSGTTGKPKGAAISHKSQLASARAQAEHCKIQDDDIMLLVLPLNHVGGITCGVLTCLLGMKPIILIPIPDMNDMLQQWRKYQPTLIGFVPTLYTLLFMTSDIKDLDTSSVRIAIVGGSNVEPTLLTQMKDTFPNATVMNLYGLSESSGALVLSPWKSTFEQNVRSIGKPIDKFEVKVVDSEGKEVSTGETGELHFRGDAVCRGYFRMKEETAESFDKDGWLHTGDMGYLDEEGYIILMGRKKEMYIQGGFNVYPVEVENLITKHPKVSMAAGIGVSNPVLGEVGRYYIVPKPGESPTEEEIINYCREHLADYKVPRQVVFCESLPMTPVGKIMKAKLKEDFEKTGE
jgi:acyl-CoA synthetase (AMP-forming)/AMP-acid ligase II